MAEYKLMNPTSLEIFYSIKKGRHSLKPDLHPWYEATLNACAKELLLNKVVCRVDLVLQTGKSDKHRRYYGLYQNDPSILRCDRIWVYTHGRHVPTVCKTIAHEFGHLAHYRTCPASRNWSDPLMEKYAEAWAEEIMKLVKP